MSGGEFDGYDLVPASVFGIRRFGIDPYGRLTGLVHRQVWLPGVNEARCRKNESGFHVSWMSFSVAGTTATGEPVPEAPEGHDAPHALCQCGFYAFHHGVASYAGDGPIGVIEGNGNAVVGPMGFRIQRAKIVALRIKRKNRDDPRALRLRRAYPDLPIFPTRSAMLAEFPVSKGFEPTPETDPEFWTRGVA